MSAKQKGSPQTCFLERSKSKRITLFNKISLLNAGLFGRS